MPSPDKPCNILVVEDEWLIALDISMRVQDMGHKVIGPAQSVARAMELICANKIDAAFLDITLRFENSFPIAEKLEELGVALTFISAYTKNDLPPQFRDYDLLSKPLPAPLFDRQLRKMLGEH